MKKFIYRNFLSYETDEMEKYLERMAVKNYLLCGMFYNLLVFSHSPYGNGYGFHVIGKDSGQDIEEEQKTLKEKGWNLVCQNYQFAVFRASLQGTFETKKVPDDKKYKSVRKAQMGYVLTGFIYMFFAVIVCIINALQIRESGLAGFTKELEAAYFAFSMGMAFLACCLIYCAAELYDCIVWCNRAKNGLKIGIPVTYSRTKFKRIMFTAGDILLGAVVLSGIILSILMLVNAGSPVIALCMCVLWLVWIFSVFISGAKYQNSFTALVWAAVFTYLVSFALIDYIH